MLGVLASAEMSKFAGCRVDRFDTKTAVKVQKMANEATETNGRQRQPLSNRPTYRTQRAEPGTEWVLIDAADQTVGRLAVQIADHLTGKNKPTYSPDVLCGAHVVVVNAEKVRFTGNNKLVDKKYYRHSGYLGGIKETTAKAMLEKHPERILQAAVKGMLPKNRLGSRQLRNLRVFAGPEHTHKAQFGKQS